MRIIKNVNGDEMLMIQVKENLDPIFETLGLLYTARHAETLELQMITVLNELGLDGKNTFQQEFTMYRKYVEIFTEDKRTNEYDDFFFGEYDNDFFFMMIEILVEKQELFTTFTEIPSEQLKREIIRRYSEIYEEDVDISDVNDFDEIFSFLTESKLNDSVKWKLANLMKNPKKYYQGLVNLVKDNLFAFEKARETVEKELADCLEIYQSRMKQKQDKVFWGFIDGMTTVQYINPTLAFAASQVLNETNSYYGLLSERILKLGNDKVIAKEALVMKFKALGDSSKFEILLSLKDAPKYNLEIAETLGLSASTVSHHMNALLVCGLVSVRKESGKVYYHIEKEGLEKLKEEINQFFM